MPQRRRLLLAGLISAFSLPLAAAALRHSATEKPATQDLRKALERQGFRDIDEGRRRGDVVLFVATGRAGGRHQLIVAPDGTIVGERILR